MAFKWVASIVEL